MSHDVRALPAYISTDADFRAFVAGLTAQFAACGLVNVTTSNEINPATVSKPASANVFPGAQIWALNDALQATKPWFLRIAYGSAGAADRPRVNIVAGTTSDLNANNNPGGQLFFPAHPGPLASKTAGVTLNSYVSGNGSYIAVMNNYDPAGGYEQAWLFERPMVNGARDGSGLYGGSFGPFAGSNINQAAFVPFSGTVGTIGPTNAAGIWLPFGPTATGHPLTAGSKAGAEVAMCPGLLPAGGKMGLITGFASYKNADLTALTAVDVDTNEGVVKYMPLGGLAPFSASYTISGAAGVPGFAIRWD